MGFFRRIFGAKRSGDQREKKDKKQQRWGFSNKGRKLATASSQSKNGSNSAAQYGENLDANKHAIAVAAATAAVAEAALAAAQAAAEVVRLTSGTAMPSSAGSQVVGTQRRLEVLAAVKIQSAFRGYLARRALRALKALVKLQALVRGHIVRKQTADMLRRMQTLVRLQSRARASRAHSESMQSRSKSSLPRHLVHSVPYKHEHQLRACGTRFDGPSVLQRCGSNSNLREIIDLDKVQSDSNWLEHWMEENIWNQSTPMRNGHADDEKNDKILEVDTWRPHLNRQQSNRSFHTSHHVYASDYSNRSYIPFDSPSKYSSKASHPNPSISSGEVLSSSSTKIPIRRDDVPSRTAENSPQINSASSRPGSSARRGPFTPVRSECSWGFFSRYSSYPNYMANTESSRAKVRSQSAPRQRLEFERYGSTIRSVQGSWDADTCSERGFPLRSDARNKAYPATTHLNRIGSARLR